MLTRVSAIAVLCVVAAPAVGLECTFGKDSLGYESIFRDMTVSDGTGTISTNRGKVRELECIGANNPNSVLSCVFHFPDGDGAYIYALSPDRTSLLFAAYVPDTTAPATWQEANCSE